MKAKGEKKVFYIRSVCTVRCHNLSSATQDDALNLYDFFDPLGSDDTATKSDLYLVHPTCSNLCKNKSVWMFLKWECPGDLFTYILCYLRQSSTRLAPTPPLPLSSSSLGNFLCHTSTLSIFVCLVTSLNSDDFTLALISCGSIFNNPLPSWLMFLWLLCIWMCRLHRVSQWLAQREIYSKDREHGGRSQRHMDKYHPLTQLPEASIQLAFNIHLTSTASCPPQVFYWCLGHITALSYLAQSFNVHIVFHRDDISPNLSPVCHPALHPHVSCLHLHQIKG